MKNLVFATKQSGAGKAKPKHPNTKGLFALVSNAVNYREQVVDHGGPRHLRPLLHCHLYTLTCTTTASSEFFRKFSQ